MLPGHLLLDEEIRALLHSSSSGCDRGQNLVLDSHYITFVHSTVAVQTSVSAL